MPSFGDYQKLPDSAQAFVSNLSIDIPGLSLVERQTSHTQNAKLRYQREPILATRTKKQLRYQREPILATRTNKETMSGQLPPHKDGDNDRFSPPGRVTGRSNHNTPQQSDQERRNLIRSVMEQARASLELISQNPGMPQRADFPSHDAWLRALLTYSLQQSEDTQRFFGNHQVRNDQDDDSDLNEQEQGPDQQEQEEANDDPAS